MEDTEDEDELLEEVAALDGAADDPAGTLLRGADERGADDAGGFVVVVPSPRPPPSEVSEGVEDVGAEEAGALLDAGAGGSFVIWNVVLWRGASWRHETSPCIWKLGEPCVTPAALPGPVSWSMNVVLCAAIAVPAKAQKFAAARSSESEVPMTERLRVMG